MNDPKLLWAVLAFTLALAGQAAIVWYRTGEHGRRLDEIEKWRLGFVQEYGRQVGRQGRDD